MSRERALWLTRSTASVSRAFTDRRIRIRTDRRVLFPTSMRARNVQMDVRLAQVSRSFEKRNSSDFQLNFKFQLTWFYVKSKTCHDFTKIHVNKSKISTVIP
jgi:hypothetical protein